MEGADFWAPSKQARGRQTDDRYRTSLLVGGGDIKLSFFEDMRMPSCRGGVIVLGVEGPPAPALPAGQ
eukprot:scaffold1248_cov221-Chaetoceros_neogracile.AAC.7